MYNQNQNPDRNKTNDQQVRARARSQQTQPYGQQQGQQFFPAPPRTQPYNQPSGGYDPYNQPQPMNSNEPLSPSTTVNFGNGQGPGRSQPPLIPNSQGSVPTPNQFTSNPTPSNNSLFTPPPPNPASFTNQSMSGANSSYQPSNASSTSQGTGQDASFYNMQPQAYQNQQQFQQLNNPSQSQYDPQQQPQEHHQQQMNPQQNPQQNQQGQIPGALPSAMPFMMAGLQQMTGAAGANGQAVNHAALGAQILQTLAPGAAGYTDQIFGGDSGEKVKSFMRMPKYYFAVNHRYVLKKLSLILMPFMNRTWSRQRGIDTGNFNGSSGDDGTCYLPPRDDVNAPDLYIPVMSFVSYVLVVGFVFGSRNAFKAQVLADYFSRGLGVLTFEVLIIKLLLYLINARPTPWLDVIAYRGYKFVGVVLTIVLGLIFPKLYVPTLLYSATAMGIYLMRSHRRIILPRDMETNEGQDLARRNAFLLFVCVLQYPIYWILARVLYVKAVKAG